MYVLINYYLNTSEQYRKEYVGFCYNSLLVKCGFHVPFRFEKNKSVTSNDELCSDFMLFFFKSCFGLVPILNDFERRNSLYFAFFFAEFYSFAGRLCHSG